MVSESSGRSLRLAARPRVGSLQSGDDLLAAALVGLVLRIEVALLQLHSGQSRCSSPSAQSRRRLKRESTACNEAGILVDDALEQGYVDRRGILGGPRLGERARHGDQEHTAVRPR